MCVCARARVCARVRACARACVRACVCVCVCVWVQVRDLSLEVSGTAEGVYTLLWKDARRLKLGAGEGGVLSETSGSVTASSVLQLMSLIDRICSAQCRLRPDEVDSAVAADSAGGSASSGAGEPVVLHLQRQDDRASMRKVTVFANGRGQLQHFTISDNAAASQMSDTRASALMMMLSEMCSGSSPFVVVRPPLWCVHLLPRAVPPLLPLPKRCCSAQASSD